MATTAGLTEQEIETLRKGVMGAGMLVALSDRGFFDTFKEAGALAKHLGTARQNTSSEVIREIGEVRGGPGFGITDSPDEVERETMEALRSGMSTLQSKAPNEVDAYRKFVLEVAQSVSTAAGGGETAETGAIDKIRSALGSN